MKDIGLYIHIPFCKSKCFYCDFNSYAGLDYLFDEYVNSLLKEIIKNSGMVGVPVSSIYIGGGTPNILPAHYIAKVLDTVYNYYKVKSSAEISIEMNPGLITKDNLNIYKNSGINRISIGVQSLQNRLLRKIGRIHTKEQFIENYNLLKKYFDNINVDLIYALPGQTIKDWFETLVELVMLKPEHISCYGLILEKGTVFYELYKKGKLQLPDDDVEIDMFHLTIDFLKNSGYNHYEISNYAISGYECRHNILYWEDEHYLGFGAGAHSYIENKRFCNIDDVAKYINLINTEGNSYTDENVLCINDEMAEFMFLGLRMMRGVCDEKFKQRFGKSMFDIYEDAIEKLKKDNLINIDDTCISLTQRGIDVSNIVFEKFLP